MEIVFLCLCRCCFLLRLLVYFFSGEFQWRWVCPGPILASFSSPPEPFPWTSISFWEILALIDDRTRISVLFWQNFRWRSSSHLFWGLRGRWGHWVRRRPVFWYSVLNFSEVMLALPHFIDLLHWFKEAVWQQLLCMWHCVDPEQFHKLSAIISSALFLWVWISWAWRSLVLTFCRSWYAFIRGLDVSTPPGEWWPISLPQRCNRIFSRCPSRASSARGWVRRWACCRGGARRRWCSWSRATGRRAWVWAGPGCARGWDLWGNVIIRVRVRVRSGRGSGGRSCWVWGWGTQTNSIH